MEKNTKLISLEENNGRAYSSYPSNKPQLNGVACPKCGSELVDSHPNITLTSFPAKKNTACTNCDYIGFRFI